MTAIGVEGVSKAFNGVTVVGDLSFEVHKGEIFGILGPNGAGKTTLLRMLIDILNPDSGKIIRNYTNDDTGYLPEERGLYKKMKVLEMLMYLASLKGADRRRALENAEKHLEMVGLSGYADKKIEELSKGMAQKVQVIAAMVHNPGLLILDEPFSGLDPVNTKLVKDMVMGMKEAGSTVILSTHMMNQAEELCDRLLMINKGKAVLYGSLDEIKSKFERSVVAEYEGEPGHIKGLERTVKRGAAFELVLENGADPNPVLAQLVSQVRVKKFEVAYPSLNDIFVRMVENEGA
ncbi:MAG TPA: ATP-binding cassette domain-containing protein [Candidatus Methanoperedenaceae archaeon]|nr:ATP-binding cassette domain-containing protein [Candidatus Methanoperedenaceae archaeon]